MYDVVVSCIGWVHDKSVYEGVQPVLQPTRRTTPIKYVLTYREGPRFSRWIVCQ